MITVNKLNDYLSFMQDANTKEDITKASKLIGFKPYFYSNKDKERIDRIVWLYKRERSIKFNLETLFTYVPDVDIDNEPNSLSQKFVRLNGWQFLSRPNMRNVLSCHKFHNSRGNYYPGGNFGYLTNPFWGCYALVSMNSNARYLYYMGFDDSDLDNLPNPLATMNVCMGIIENGTLSMGFSRVYGGYEYNWSTLYNYLGESGIQPVKLASRGNTPGKTYSVKHLFQNIPVIPQIKIGRSIPLRYGDIEKARNFSYNENGATVVEHLTCKKFVTNQSVEKQIICDEELLKLLRIKYYNSSSFSTTSSIPRRGSISCRKCRVEYEVNTNAILPKHYLCDTCLPVVLKQQKANIKVQRNRKVHA